MSAREFADKYVSKWISRKLLVFLIASTGLFTGHIESGDWVVVSTAYVATEGFVSIVERVLKAKSGASGVADLTQ